jgi:hypothetical protein
MFISIAPKRNIKMEVPMYIFCHAFILNKTFPSTHTHIHKKKLSKGRAEIKIILTSTFFRIKCIKFKLTATGSLDYGLQNIRINFSVRIVSM